MKLDQSGSDLAKKFFAKMSSSLIDAGETEKITFSAELFPNSNASLAKENPRKRRLKFSAISRQPLKRVRQTADDRWEMAENSKDGIGKRFS